MRLGLGLIAALAVPVVATAPPDAPPVVALSTLEGAVVPERFVLTVDLAGATSAKLVVDGTYAGEDDEPPLQFAIELSAGEHRAVVRAIVDAPDDPDTEARVDSRFTVSADAPTPIAPPSPMSTAATTNAAGELVVTTPDQLREALATAPAGRGDPGRRRRVPFEPSPGRRRRRAPPAAPITLRGSRARRAPDQERLGRLRPAHHRRPLAGRGPDGRPRHQGHRARRFGRHGDRRRRGVRHRRRGRALPVVLERRRAANSFIHDTGRNSPQYGEGVYVGSANSNWSKYECTDAVEGVGEGDNTERVVIEDNVFEDITAEGADLKEGTDSGVAARATRSGGSAFGDEQRRLRGRRQGQRLGHRGQRRGRDRRRLGRRRRGAAERVRRRLPDPLGVRRLRHRQRVPRATVSKARSPASASASTRPANVVTCDNEAPGAALGLVGDNGQPSACVTGA